MPRDSNGAFARAVSPYVPGTTALAASVNAEMDDIAGALTGSLPRNGVAPMTGPLNMAGKKIADLAAPQVGTDAARKDYVDGLSVNRTLPVSGNYSGNFPLTAQAVFLYVTIPAGTRYLWLNGYVRGAAPGGALDVLAKAVLRNVGDTADVVNFGTVGAGSVAAGGSIVAPLSMAWDLGAPIAGDQTMRLSAVTSNGQTLNLYEYRASLACGK